MAKCAYCGAETLLYSSEIPICVECMDARSKGTDRKPQQVDKAPENQPESQYRKAAGG
jgi:hypothetical protein